MPKDQQNRASTDMNETVCWALPAVVGELQITTASVPAWASAAGHLGVRESDLQRGLCRALQAQLGPVVSIEGPLPPGTKQHWDGRLGGVDVMAKLDNPSETYYFETKLCSTDKLYESVWDLLKLALLTTVTDGATGYLVYAAPTTGWEPKEDRPIPIFKTGTFGVAETLHQRFPKPWRWCLQGTKTTRPTRLPADIHTELVASTPISTPAGAARVMLI